MEEESLYLTAGRFFVRFLGWDRDHLRRLADIVFTDAEKRNERNRLRIRSARLSAAAFDDLLIDIGASPMLKLTVRPSAEVFGTVSKIEVPDGTSFKTIFEVPHGDPTLA